jgi:hypothetical protein
MQDDTSLSALFATFYGNGTVAGLALLGLIVIGIVVTAQLEALWSACRHLMAHRRQVINAQQKMAADVAAARKTAQAIDEALPELKEAVQALAQEYETLSVAAAEARQLHIREVVMSDIFVLPNDRPFVATIYRPKADPDEPLAEQWRAGREHVLYAADQKTGATRFAQRFPANHGFVVGPVSEFDIPRNAPEELPTLEAAGRRAP